MLLPLQVDSAITATEAQLSAYVSRFVNEQLSKAREQLQRYSDRWEWECLLDFRTSIFQSRANQLC